MWLDYIRVANLAADMTGDLIISIDILPQYSGILL